MFTENISYTAAFIAGLLSFFSPCVLPLIPAYFTFITGLSIDELTKSHTIDIRKKVFLSTLLYVLGFSSIFIMMGASASFVGSYIHKYSSIIRIFGGIIIIMFGIHLSGLISVPWLDQEKRIHLKKKPLHFFGAFVIGMAFGLGWSPCIGPLLGSILFIASSKETIQEGVVLLSIYSAGIAIPFIIISIFINFLIAFFKKGVKAIKYINLITGILLIIIGLLLLTNIFSMLTRIPL